MRRSYTIRATLTYVARGRRGPLYEQLYTSLLKETRDPSSGRVSAAAWPIFFAAILRQSYKVLGPLAIMLVIFFLYVLFAEPARSEGTIMLSSGEAQELRGTVVFEPSFPSFPTLVGGFFLAFVAGAILGPLLAGIRNYRKWVFEDVGYVLLPKLHGVACGIDDDLSAEIRQARPTIAIERSNYRVREILTKLVEHSRAKQEGAAIAVEDAGQDGDDPQ